MIRVAVIGRSTPPFSEELMSQASVLGREVASRGCVLLSGACNGLPHAAVLAAKQAGAKTAGYSPADGPDRHVDAFCSPLDGFSELHYFGRPDWSVVKNFTWRSAHLIDDADVVFCVEGSWGTMSEVALVFETEKPFGVLESGGAAGFVRTLEKTLAKRRSKPVIFGTSARELAAEVLDGL